MSHLHCTVTCWRLTAAPWKTWTRPSPPPRCCPHRIRRSGHSYRIQREEEEEKRKLYSVHQWSSPGSVEIPHKSIHGNKDFGFSGISHVRLRAEFWVLQTRVYLTKENVHIKEIREYSYYMPEMKLKSFSRYIFVWRRFFFQIVLYFWDLINF